MQTFQSLQKLDIFALGIILADLVCNPVTLMEVMKIDDSIKSTPPKLPKNYKLEELVEGKLLLLLVSPYPEQRPTIEDIRNVWLPEWGRALEAQEENNSQKK